MDPGCGGFEQFPPHERNFSIVGSMTPAEPGQQGGQWGVWVAALGAAAHSRDLFCCANRVEVTPS